VEAHEQFEESLRKLVERFNALAPRHFEELRPIGDALSSIKPTNEKDKSLFLRDLKSLSAAVICVRKRTENSAAAKDVPVPPYDLFLPFRSEAPKPDAAVFDKAISSFNKTVQELSDTWAPYATVSTSVTQNLTNPKLQLLRDRIVEQIDRCNVLIVDFDLFKPSLKAYTDLIHRKLAVTVTSVDDFKSFIASLHQVICEGLPNEVRKWQLGQTLPLNLTQQALTIIKGEAFRHINILRNKSSHDDADARRELAPIYQKLIGVPAIPRDDSELWLGLQIGLLENLASSLEQLSRTLEASQRN
jgi:hypothetical protein